MADEPAKPRRRRRKASSEDAPVSEARAVSAAESAAEGLVPSASDPDATSEEISPTPDDVEAEDAAADVVLEAEDEVDADTDAEVAAQTTEADEDSPAEAEGAKPARRARA